MPGGSVPAGKDALCDQKRKGRFRSVEIPPDPFTCNKGLIPGKSADDFEKSFEKFSPHGMKQWIPGIRVRE